MSVIDSDAGEEDAIITAAKLMLVAARTAPKACAIDCIVTKIATGEEKNRIAGMMDKKQEKKTNIRFRRDAENLRMSTAVLLIGVKGTRPKTPEDPLNCGACGYPSCAELIKAKKKMGEDFTGPNCIFQILDLGIAVGSVVKLASELNIDNRIMYTIGAAAKALGLLDADVIMGVPLSATGKNLYYDRGLYPNLPTHQKSY